jgi:hypothetical protein
VATAIRMVFLLRLRTHPCDSYAYRNYGNVQPGQIGAELPRNRCDRKDSISSKLFQQEPTQLVHLQPRRCFNILTPIPATPVNTSTSVAGSGIGASAVVAPIRMPRFSRSCCTYPKSNRADLKASIDNG